MDAKDLTKYEMVSKIINDITYELDPDLIEYLKVFFQNNIEDFDLPLFFTVFVPPRVGL